LAVTTATRLEALPNVPTMANSCRATTLARHRRPQGTPAEIVDRLNKEINAALANPKIKARFADLGFMVPPGAPADFAKLIAKETEKWGKVIRAANLRAE
jgi:tripartite-type tricarboxylate transporter receptor subunit TctC